MNCTVVCFVVIHLDGMPSFGEAKVSMAVVRIAWSGLTRHYLKLRIFEGGVTRTLQIWIIHVAGRLMNDSTVMFLFKTKLFGAPVRCMNAPPFAHDPPDRVSIILITRLNQVLHICFSFFGSIVSMPLDE
jgi:hypothetical protein